MSDLIYPRGYKAKPDNEKTDADWEIHEAILDWQQAAFNAHWYECSKFLDASRGGKQTSNDLHMLCQGYALAAAKITALEASLAEARRQALEEAAKACEAERLYEPQDDSDAAYDRAIDDCAQAIRALADPLLDRQGNGKEGV